MSAMVLNLAANFLGLGDAATPFGVKAMRELDSLNPRKGVASDSMALFLAINTVVALGFGRQVKVYEAFVTGAKESFRTVVAILPFLVGVLVAFGMFRASGALELMVRALSPVLSPIGFPPEALPLALLRPLSGNGSLVLLGDGLKAYGPDSFLGDFLSVLNGSTQTTFYVVALYFGAVQIKAVRHTIAACLLGLIAAIAGALVICTLLFAQK